MPADSYNSYLVALSVVFAVCSSYAAPDPGARVTAALGRMRQTWLVGGACAMGTRIWPMHSISMLAFSLPVQISNDWPTVLASLLTAMRLPASTNDHLGLMRTPAS